MLGVNGDVVVFQPSELLPIFVSRSRAGTLSLVLFAICSLPAAVDDADTDTGAMDDPMVLLLLLPPSVLAVCFAWSLDLLLAVLNRSIPSSEVSPSPPDEEGVGDAVKNRCEGWPYGL